MSERQEAVSLGTIDPTALRRAKAVVERLRLVYIEEWAPAALDELEAAVLALRTPAAPPHRADEGGPDRRDQILRLTHDMKGQAGTFGLDLLTDFATSMHSVALSAVEIGVREADVFLAHIMAMRTALQNVASHPEGILDDDLEAELRAGLLQVVRHSLN